MKVTDTHIYFWNGTYSNWHPAKITYPSGEVFANTEQAFMWFKAKHFGDTEMMAKILKTPNPRDVKKLGREVKGYDDAEWTAVRYGYMLAVNTLKFTLIEEYKKELLATGEKIIVEASPYDKVWGVGLLEDDPLILDEKNWQGENLLGKVCMTVRSQLRRNQVVYES